MRPDPRKKKPIRKPGLRSGGRTPRFDRAKILGIAEHVVAARGCELLEQSVSDSLRIRLVVDRDDGGSLDTRVLVGLIQELRHELFEAGIDPGQFDIEFDSPGEQRLLETARHFERFAGERVRVTLAEPDAEGASVWVVDLLGADGDAPRIRSEDGVERTLARDAWLRIRLVPPTPKRRPVPKSAQQKKAKRAKKSAARSKKKP